MSTDPHVQRLIEAVNALGVRLECPSCGHREWAPLEANVVLATEADGRPEQRGAECLALACKRCGFVRLHAAQVLEESP